MNRIYNQWIGRICVLLSATCLSATATSVTVLDARHITYVARGYWVTQELILEERKLEAPVAHSDSLGVEPGWVNARAETDLLSISAFAAADYPLHDNSTASAETEFTFSPETDSLTPININFTGWDRYSSSYGYVRLLDVTANSMLWDYYWDGFSGTVPWEDHPGETPRGVASLTLNTMLFDTHNYRFSMFVAVGSQDPSSSRVQIRASGLEVPEPAVFSFLALGAAALIARRRRWR